MSNDKRLGLNEELARLTTTQSMIDVGQKIIRPATDPMKLLKLGSQTPEDTDGPAP